MTTVIVVLEIQGKPSDAFEVVDALLDAGSFQDSINDHEVDGCGKLRVKSAVCRGTGRNADDEKWMNIT